MDYKQVIIVRKDLNMSTGKAISQGAHASMAAILNKAKTYWITKLVNFFGMNLLIVNLNDPAMGPWLSGKFKKIVVYVESEADLLCLYYKATEAGLITSLILDSGLTEFDGVPTYTSVSIGPDISEKINPFTSHLKLLRTN